MYKENKDHKKYDHKEDWDCKKDSGKDHNDEHKKVGCVDEVLEAILKAQNKVKKVHECKNSCKASINELLDERKKPKKNTIPFILYCGCEPFRGTGVTTFFHGTSKKKKFACVNSFIFRIKDLDNNCAVLELLSFKPDKSSSGKGDDHSPCDQIHCENVDDLVKTGICITVDLSCFCGITCLPAIRL